MRFCDGKEVTIKDGFWSPKMDTVIQKLLPYQWAALNDEVEGAEKSYCMQNFRVAAEMTKNGETGEGKGDTTAQIRGIYCNGRFNGFVFQDSDFSKWIEAVGYSLLWHKDADLERTADAAIEIVCAAQQPDGYLDTYYIINGLEGRFTNMRDHHELYCFGHLLEGAIAYYQATGKKKLLDSAIRFADYVEARFGPEEGKEKGYPGHEVAEMALVRLYELTKEERYLKLAKFFIEERGREPLYFAEEDKRFHRAMPWAESFGYQYYQAGKPVLKQRVAEGHAVRAVYLYCGMADVARHTGDEALKEACRTLWNNITRKQMYVTGGIGATSYGEAFTYDYDLPNDTAYAETCASIGMAFFAKRMLAMEVKGEYADILERELYNGIISGMSLSGTEFFYVNPLEAEPLACRKNPLRAHVKPVRQKWFGCACCPPNLARILTSLGSYVYAVEKTTIYTHLYIGGTADFEVEGEKVSYTVHTNYPWEETVTIAVRRESPGTPLTLAFRLPGWCRDYAVLVNGECAVGGIADGYLFITDTFAAETTVTLQFSMPVRVLRANTAVREDIGKVALMRGPVVYCMEEADNGKGLHRLFVDTEAEAKTEYVEELGGVTVLHLSGYRLKEDALEELYSFEREEYYEEKELTFIPYYAWANRGEGEMTVFVHRI